MSLSRIMLSALMMIASIFAVNAMAADASAAQQNQPAAAATATATTDQAADKSARHSAAKIDINSASQAALAKILGAKKAQAIIDYRNKNGAFQSLSDLKNITNKKGKPLFSDKSIKRLSNRLIVASAANAPASGSSQQ